MKVRIEGDKKLSDIIRRNEDIFKANPSLMKIIAHRSAQVSKTNARSKGGRSFWRAVAHSVTTANVTALSATILTQHVAGAHKEFGGPIRPVSKLFLTIPIKPESRGKTTSDFEKLFRVGNVLAQTRAGALYPLFALSKGVMQDPDPWFVRSAQAAEIATEELNRKAIK